MPRRNRRKRRRRAPIRSGSSIVVSVVALALRRHPRARSRFHALRCRPARRHACSPSASCGSSVLRPNERVLASVNVWQRPAHRLLPRDARNPRRSPTRPAIAHPVGGRLRLPRPPAARSAEPPDAPPTFDSARMADRYAGARSPRRAPSSTWRSALRIAAPREQQLVIGIPGRRGRRCRRRPRRDRQEVRHAARHRLAAARGAARTRPRATRRDPRRPPRLVPYGQARRGAVLRRRPLRRDSGSGAAVEQSRRRPDQGRADAAGQAVDGGVAGLPRRRRSGLAPRRPSRPETIPRHSPKPIRA